MIEAADYLGPRTLDTFDYDDSLVEGKLLEDILD